MEVNRAPPLLQKLPFIEGILDLQECGGDHGRGRCISVSPLIGEVEGTPGMVGYGCSTRPGGFSGAGKQQLSLAKSCRGSSETFFP